MKVECSMGVCGELDVMAPAVYIHGNVPWQNAVVVIFAHATPASSGRGFELSRGKDLAIGSISGGEPSPLVWLEPLD